MCTDRLIVLPAGGITAGSVINIFLIEDVLLHPPAIDLNDEVLIGKVRKDYVERWLDIEKTMLTYCTR